MKIKLNLIILFTILTITLVALTGCTNLTATRDDRIILGESYTLENGRILNGDLNVIGGVVVIEETASVNGNVFVLGGLVTIDGTITGDLTAIGGTVNLSETATLEGDLISPVSFININPNARVLGERIDQWILPGINLQQFTNLAPQPVPVRTFALLPILTRIGKFLAMTLLMAGLAALLLLIMPKPTERMTQALIAAPWHLLGYGALTSLVMASALVLIITICLIPVIAILGLVFALAVLVGWLALGYELGRRIASTIFNASWHPVLAAVVGNLVLYIMASALRLVPCLGGFLVFIIMLFALGMAVATLFGTYPYPRTQTATDEPVVLFESKSDQKTDTSFKSKEPSVPVVAPQIQVVEPPVRPEVPIEALNLGSRINNTLLDAGLTNVDEVLQKLAGGDESMLAISGFGEKSLQDLKDALKALGYDLP
jgi:hypothetical protein